MNALQKNFQRYQQNAVKKFSPLLTECREKNSPLKSQILQIFTANFNAYLKFTGNIIEVSDSWRSGIRSCQNAGGERCETVHGSFFFRKKSVQCGEKNFTAIKKQKLTAFNAKTFGRFAAKKFFFHRYSPLILHYVFTKPRPG